MFEGQITPSEWRFELLKLEQLTSDPSNPKPGDEWLRVDQKPSYTDANGNTRTAVAQYRRVRQDGTTITVPVAQLGDATDSEVIDKVRANVSAGGSPTGKGFVPFAKTGASYPKRKLQHPVDGKVGLHDALTARVIPDGEDFEHNDLSGTYGGDLTLFSIQTGVVDGGSYALEASGAGGSFYAITRETTNPFDRSGIRIDYREYHDENNTAARGGIALFTSVTGFSSADGYAFYVDTSAGSGSECRLRRVDGGSATGLDTFGVVSDNTWVDGTIKFQNGDITWTIDGNTTTVSDNNYTSLLLAFHTFDGAEYWDNITFSTI